MRYTILAFLVITVCAVALALPANTDTDSSAAKKASTIKEAKNIQKTASTCAKDCGDNYNPVCAKAKKSSKERLITFGSECVMANYNCAHKDDEFEVKSNGECGGNVSVRLS